MSAPAPGVTYEQYSARQAVIVAALVRTLWALLLPFRPLRLSVELWAVLVATIYPHVARARTESAELARQFYDAERERRRPDSGRHPVDLPGYAPAWLAESLEPYQARFAQPDAQEATLAQVVSIAAKHVQDAGRKTTLRAVESDRDVIGWARVAGGAESCAFCTMLISRGPVYLYASTAGLDTDDTTAADAADEFLSSGDSAFMDSLMQRWHPNCDCTVVPVYDTNSWPRRDEFVAAQQLWAAASTGRSGRDALNALRRALYAGETAEELPPALRTAA